MKFLFIFILFFGLDNSCGAQQCYSLDQGWIPCSTSDTLNDKLTGNYYVVVRSEKCIKAFDSDQKILWQTYPWKSNDLSQFIKGAWDPKSVDEISINAIDFPKTEYMGGSKSIVIYFSHKIVGVIVKKNGRFGVLGQN